MSKFKKIFLGKGYSISSSIIAAIFTIVPEDCFKLIKINQHWTETINVLIVRFLVAVIIYVIVYITYIVIQKNKKKVIVSDENCLIQIEYGDLSAIDDGKVVINFDECFTTNVGDAPADIKPNSVCGQYLINHPTNVQDLIDRLGIKAARVASSYKKQRSYTPGTIVPNGNYLLMAFAKLDENGLGCLTYDEYLNCLDYLWKQIDLYHGTDDIYMPVLGSGILRFDKDLTQQDLLNIMIASYRLSPRKMKRPYKLHIVCKQREGFSLDNIYGV
ncbi:MAG: hypothetical protein IJF87_03420 [Erysipelotrichaceae bacterium]|nr:hypothetical protein [Erysipelotrichaceae bacterium]